MALGVAAVIGGLGIFYGGLAAFFPEPFPAPPISRFAALDEKLRFHREHPDFQPTLISVGSSVAWRQIAGDIYAEYAGGKTRFLDASIVHLKIHQTRAMLDFYLDHFQQVDHIVMITSLPDYENCTTEPRELFNASEAAAYAFGQWPAAYFYLRYFAPRRFVQTALSREAKTQPFLGDMYIDDWGSGPLQVPDSMKRGLRYGTIEVDKACVQELGRLIGDVAERGKHLTIVFPPIHPEYRKQYPQSIKTLSQIIQHAREVGARHGARIIDLHADDAYGDKDYFDALHLQYPAVRRLSAQVVERLGQRSVAGKFAVRHPQDGRLQDSRLQDGRPQDGLGSGRTVME